MRILHIPEITVPATAAAPVPSSPSIDPERVDVLESVAKSVLEKIQALEERVRALEQIQTAPAPAPAPDPTPVSSPKPEPPIMRTPQVSVIVDAQVVNKNLMEKMWKYLNNEQPPRTI